MISEEAAYRMMMREGEDSVHIDCTFDGDRMTEHHYRNVEPTFRCLVCGLDLPYEEMSLNPWNGDKICKPCKH